MVKKNINNLANAKAKQNPRTNQLFDHNETTTPVHKARGPGPWVLRLTSFIDMDGPSNPQRWLWYR